VSVLLDANGANTTAAAAVRAGCPARQPAGLLRSGTGGTGPVGQRVALLLAKEGAQVRLGSRQASRAAGMAATIRTKVPGAALEPVAAGSSDEVKAALGGCALVVAAGAAGVCFCRSRCARHFRD